MAQLTNTFETFDAVGGREDLQNVIYDISRSTPPDINKKRTPN